jgi:glycosyltransferase involved in cell wall biosynthesis
MAGSNPLLAAAKRAWRAAAPRRLRGLAGPVMLRLAESRARAALAKGEPAAQPGPLIVSGLLAESKGVSEGARLTIAGLAAAGYSPIAHDIRPSLARGPGADAPLPTDRPGGVWLTHLNAPELVHALACTEPAHWLGRRRIGYWAYELQPVPAQWARAAGFLHEIWAVSEFAAEAVRKAGVTTPVRAMPHPAHLGPKAIPDRARFGIPADALAVLAMGDLASSSVRKNLSGAIDIYRRAFPAEGPQRLVVKTHGSALHPEFAAEAEAARAGRSDIILIADDLPRDQVASLVASVDVLLSPHRAEGFGLTLAEAFLAGVPALATNWSGNLDFMAGLDPLLIASTQVPVLDPSGVYRAPASTWAEPDPLDAATKLRALAEDPALRRALAEQGRANVLKLADHWTRDALEKTALGRRIRPG